MAWVRFQRDFDWSPRSGTTLTHKAPFAISVTEACAKAAVAAEAGKRMKTPTRTERQAIEAEYEAARGAA